MNKKKLKYNITTIFSEIRWMMNIIYVHRRRTFVVRDPSDDWTYLSKMNPGFGKSDSGILLVTSQASLSLSKITIKSFDSDSGEFFKDDS